MENKVSPDPFKALVGFMVHVDTGEPDSGYGRLIAVKHDHLVLDSEQDGFIYYILDHIKSISIDTTDHLDLHIPFDPNHPRYIDGDTLDEITRRMVYRPVQINRGGPKPIRGILINTFKDFVLLVFKQYILLIFIRHIRNISCCVLTNRNSENDEQQNDDRNQQTSAPQNPPSELQESVEQDNAQATASIDIVKKASMWARIWNRISQGFRGLGW